MAEPIIGQDPLVRKVATLAERLAHTTHPIFIDGEDGVGRGHVARYLHDRGPRAAAPFSVIDLGAVARGATLDAMVSHREAAAGGTLFIRNCQDIAASEIGAVVALLSEVVDATRVVISAAASDRTAVGDTCPMVERLGALALYLPPLRLRRADIPALARYFVDQWNNSTANDRVPVTLCDAALLEMWSYDWPGNVRELRDEVRASAAQATDGSIRPEHLSLRVYPQSRRKPVQIFGASAQRRDPVRARRAGSGTRPIALV